MIVYIIYSKILDRYYVGSTNDNFNCRLKKHNSAFYTSKSYTAKANDWIQKCILECDDSKQMTRIEKHIKRMKSRKYIEKIIASISIQEQLLK